MKRIIQAVVVASLFTGSQALADDPARMLPSQWTYADRHAAEIAEAAVVEAFPGSVDEDGITVMSSSAGGRTARQAKAEAFPASADDAGITVPSMSTYADEFAGEHRAQAGRASDPALSQ